MLNAIERSVAAQRAADQVADWRTERAAWLAAFDAAMSIHAGTRRGQSASLKVGKEP